MGIVENSNRATIEAASYIFTKFCVVPRAGFLADGLTHWARREWKDAALSLGFESPVPEDRAFTLQAMQAQPDLFTKNEWRGIAGKNPMPGWDDEFPSRSVPSPFGLPPTPASEPDEDEADEVDDEGEAKQLGDRRLLRLAAALGQRR